MIKFGDIYRFRDQVYIHLTVKDDGVTYYAAKIISEPDLVNKFIKRRESLFVLKNSSPGKVAQYKLVTCFIKLTTDDFKDCLAHLARPDSHGITELEPLGELNESDIKSLKREILDNPDVLPPPVIRYVQELSEK
ncbi:hypothetical protein A2316_00450 [Candidatus Falkowbacteria bacterium RIFOXYB2_FULL_38_15]|uniref:Uncharacterized protein n=1 Tax=Candidatus Falkowbacteria bacterium RIFOXYA2_FULL_38_12 TaxID=1797993 RepID=A0A1F5S1K3_9BACT|nr:MAG: hypothetical protein A2257_04405 [Candidatus Falkowbacteria bacterium RIFOXYA2_FULL_38_12]OGF32867.1 MAG: hypothetical protein A2316_00450 [Candidatus Falkowbacteria bacterium RIFOXYB2_FULL_38_15]OGF44003.1 MAG: hypothetical protein A2555_01180 [Candidatus Falkowbacteria bacterium RIFOXYD2_FULL_39_16]